MGEQNLAAAAQPMRQTGHRAGIRMPSGWGALAVGAMVAYQSQLNGAREKDLTIGKVIINHRDIQQVYLGM